MSNNKPIVILTNFWDAEALIDLRVILLSDHDKVYKIDFSNDNDHMVYSISLSSPSFEKMPYVQKSYKGRLDVFCPSYDLLMDYKNNQCSWENYIVRYKEILKKRKAKIINWINSLKEDCVYILCCWENTSGNSHCHRQILHDSFLKSRLASEKMIPVYRSGEKIFKNCYDKTKLELQRNKETISNIADDQYYNLYPIITNTTYNTDLDIVVVPNLMEYDDDGNGNDDNSDDDNDII